MSATRDLAAALLGDTQHLSQAEFGAYMLMLVVAWRRPDCALPNDDVFLARVTKSSHRWRRIKPAVMPLWSVGEDGYIRARATHR
jgi:uncharacterized protein YdaU (DUF1376 family)